MLSWHVSPGTLVPAREEKQRERAKAREEGRGYREEGHREEEKRISSSFVISVCVKHTQKWEVRAIVLIVSTHASYRNNQRQHGGAGEKEEKDKQWSKKEKEKEDTYEKWSLQHRS